MTVTLKPSDVYLGMTSERIRNYLEAAGHRIVDFRIVRTGDIVLFYNSGLLSIGTAKVLYAGYPRFILEPVPPTGIEKFWE